MPADEVKGELEQVENELEMNLATNRNVIDQYQQRQAQVRLSWCRFVDALLTVYQIEQLTQDLAEEEARAGKISSSIETARACFFPPAKPSMWTLTDDIGLLGACTQGSRF